MAKLDTASSPSSRPAASDATVAGFLPLSAVDTHLLLALSREELYGYALLQSMDQDSDGTVRMDIGALYRALDRMLRQGLIAEADHRPATPTRGKPRRYYRIRELGRAVLAAELTRLRRLVDVAGLEGARS